MIKQWWCVVGWGGWWGEGKAAAQGADTVLGWGGGGGRGWVVGGRVGSRGEGGEKWRGEFDILILLIFL